ncbi:MAG: nitrous oxide reductase family maturation protein NosD, partial [Candidatus Hodarchaeota archaeon]
NGGGSPRGVSDLSMKIHQYGGGNGVFLDPSNYNTITNNQIFNNSENGIRLTNSSHNLIDGNDIYGNGNNSGGSPRGISDLSMKIQQYGGGNGVFLDPSDYNNITGNSIFNNSGDGVTIINSSNNLVQGNDIYGNGNNGGGSSRSISDISFSIQQFGGGNGVFLDPSDKNYILGNNIHDNSHHGIIMIDSDENTIFENILIHNGLYGIYIDSGASNRVYWNDLLGNNLEGTSQAFDEGDGSEFKYNYWDEWTFPDEGDDGTVDNPYRIAGKIENSDRFPSTLPQNPETMDMHLISRPRLLYPNGGETLSDTIIVQWARSTDFWGHTISYDLYYSVNNGETWNLMDSKISNLTYLWDTTTINDGIYLIKVVTICSEGLQVEDISDAPFTIHNDKQHETTTTELTVESSKPTTKPDFTSAPSLMILFSSIILVIFLKRDRRDKSR